MTTEIDCHVLKILQEVGVAAYRRGVDYLGEFSTLFCDEDMS